MTNTPHPAPSPRINREYLRMFQEMPLMVKLQLKPGLRTATDSSQGVLIVHNGLIGEFLSALPAIIGFMEELQVPVDLLLSPPLKPLLRHLKGIGRVISRPSVYRRETERTDIFPDTPQPCYSRIIVLQLSREAYGLIRSLACGHLQIALGGYLRYGSTVLRTLGRKKEVKQLAETLFEMLQVKPRELPSFDELFTFTPQQERAHERFPFLRGPAHERILLHTGSGWSMKHWPLERWLSLLHNLHRRHPYRFIFVGATAQEQAVFAELSARLPFTIHSLIREVDLGELALIMRRCHRFLGVDSGPRHLAHLVRLPSICLLGPGPKIFSPQDRNAVYIDRSNCRCTNLFCTRNGLCMKSIDVIEVLEAWDRLDGASLFIS